MSLNRNVPVGKFGIFDDIAFKGLADSLEEAKHVIPMIGPLGRPQIGHRASTHGFKWYGVVISQGNVKLVKR